MLMLSGVATADFAYTIETLGGGPVSEKEHLNVEHAFDGVDPITHHILFSTPGEGAGQLLWQTTANDVTWDLMNDEFSYPYDNFAMVVDAKLPIEAEIEYSVLSLETEREVRFFRHMRVAAPWSVDTAKVDSLEPGYYVLQAEVRYVDEQDNRTVRSRFAQSLKVVAEVEAATEGDEYGDGQDLMPGDGWGNDILPVPANEPSIAHWNVVPEQSIDDGFTVGVIAYHLDGVERVEIAVNGGEPVVIREMSVNPRTGCSEYWTPLDLSEHNGPVQLRATVFSKDGQATPVVQREGHDLTLYTESMGEVLELPAGRHTLNPVDLPEKGWLTVRPAPGVAREDCIIVGKSRYWNDGNLKVQGITWETPRGGGMCVADPNSEDYTRVWFDDCDIQGDPKTWWLASQFDESIYTDTKISNTQNVWNLAGKLLVRNVHIGRVYEDVIRSGGLFVNLKVDRIDRGEYTSHHPDFLQANWAGNLILQDVDVPSNEGQGIFPNTLTNSAFVRVNIHSTSHGKALQLMGKTNNTLFKDCVFDGGSILRKSRGFEVLNGERLIFDNVKAGRGPDFLPHGWDLPGVEVR